MTADVSILPVGPDIAIGTNPDAIPPAPEEHPESASLATREAAVINAEQDGTGDYVNRWADLQGDISSPVDKRNMAAMNAFSELIDAQREGAVGAMMANPNAAPDIQQAFQEGVMDLKEQAGNITAPKKVLVNNLANPFTATQDTKDRIAARAFNYEWMHARIADQNVWTFARDIALELIPLKFLTDTLQATGQINPFATEEIIRTIVSNFHLLSAEEQKEQFPIIFEDLLTTQPKFRAQQIAEAMLNPDEEEALAFEFGPLALLDAAAFSAGIVKSAARAFKSLSTAKIAENLDNPEAAAKMVSTVLVDKTGVAQEAVGMDKLTAYNSALPLTGIDEAATTTASGKVQNATLDFTQKLKGRLPGLGDNEGFIAEGFLASVDRPIAEQRIDRLFDNYLNTLRKDPKISAIDDIERVPQVNGVKFKFTMRDPEGNTDIGTFEKTFTENDIGFWENITDPDAGPLTRLWSRSVAGSPKSRATGSDIAGEVDTAARLDFTEQAAASKLSSLLLEAGAPLRKIRNPLARKKRFSEVEDVLRIGDNRATEFSKAELMSGSVNGTRFTEDQVAAYGNYRLLFNSIGVLRNNVARGQMERRGVKTIFSKDVPIGFGAVDDTADEAVKRLRRENVRTIQFLDEKRDVNIFKSGNELDSQVIRKAYSDGFVLAKLEESIKGRAGSRFDLVFVRPDNVSQLPVQVLRLNVGYVPRFNPKGAFFVQAFMNGTKNGVGDVVRKVVRGFDSEKQANEFRTRFEKGVRLGATDFPEDATISVVSDGTLEAFRTGDTGLSSAEGLFYGARRDTPPPFGLPEDLLDTPRAGAFEALSMYLENTSRFLTRNEARMGMQRRWENTVRKMFNDRSITFDDPGTKVLEASPDLRFWRDQIRQWNGFRTKGESLFEDFTQTIYEGLIDGFGRGRLSDYLYTVGHKDPVAAIKSATFHATLGSWNPIQIIVQASGAAVALSQNVLRPDKMGTILFRANGLSTVQHMRNSPKAFDKVARAFGWSPDELRLTKKLWDKTGLFESTLINADVEAAKRGFGITFNSFRKLVNSGTLPFRIGELFNRRISFLTALDELGGAKKVLGNSELEKQLLTRTSDFLLNLGKANRAAFQKGIFGIPTQFLQIMTKTGEAYAGLNGVSTFGQRLKLMFSQIALYGGAGVPLGGMISKYVADQAGIGQQDINQGEISEGTLRLMNGGLADWTLYSMLDLDATIADRTALANGFDQSIMAFFEKEMTIAELSFGPAGGVSQRILDRFNVQAPFFGNYSMDIVKEDLTNGKILDATRYLTGQFADSIAASPMSSMNQVRRYIHMRDFDALFDNKGRQISRREYEDRTELAVLFGFKANDLDLKITLQDLNRDTDLYVTEKTDMVMWAWQDYMRHVKAFQERGLLPTQEVKDEFSNYFDVVMASTPNDTLRQRVREAFVGRIEGPQTQLEQQTREFYNNYIDELVNDVHSLHTKITNIR